jgi:hypothetical protein
MGEEGRREDGKEAYKSNQRLKRPRTLRIWRRKIADVEVV